MTENLGSLEGLAERPTAESGRFDHVSIALHWLTVLFIMGQFTSARLLEAVDHDSSLAVAILATHRTMGVLTWIVVLARLVWRRNFAYLTPFPQTMPKPQQSIAKPMNSAFMP
jgi:cytochrome b561